MRSVETRWVIETRSELRELIERHKEGEGIALNGSIELQSKEGDAVVTYDIPITKLFEWAGVIDE